MFKNHLTFGYVLFVGIPLLILIGTLRAGGRLTALPALSGEWTVQARETPTPDKCAGPLASAVHPVINVYQTGPDLLIAFNDFRKTTLAARLENDRIASTGNRAGAPANCGSTAAIRFEAGLTGTSGRRSLLGQVSFDGCASCAPVQFIATRRPLPARKVMDSQMIDLFKLILQIGVVLLTARIVGMIFKKIHQPQVMGEMVAGILLGPTLFGWLASAMSKALFPAPSLGYLNALSQVGLVLFMFLVGLSLNPKELHSHGHAAVLTSHVSIVTPFCLGSLTALYLYPRLSDDSVSFMGFALFMGAAMSITAFPVLARILTERDLLRSRMGTLAIACAAVDDVTGWCILAYIILLIRTTHGGRPIWVTLGGLILYVFLMLFGIRRLLTWFENSFRNRGRLTENAMACMVLLVLASALTTEALGIHLLFGAFLMGAIMPKSPDFIRYVLHKFETVTVLVLLPLFFAYSGLRTNIGIGHNGMWWVFASIVIVVAIAGKLGGSMIAARFAGMAWRDAASLGILMNTRGLMELVILNIGLDIGVISPAVFSMMVLMALVTTFMTTPLLEWAYPARLMRAEVNDLAEQRVA